MKTLVMTIAVLAAGCGAAPRGAAPRLEPSDNDALARPLDLPESSLGERHEVEGDALDRLAAACDASCPHRDRLALAQRLLDRAASLRESAETDTETDALARGAPDEEVQAKLREAIEDETRARAWLEALASDPTLPPALLEEVLEAQLGACADESARLLVAQRIVRELPPSALVAEAWLLIGEQAFVEADLSAAGLAYERVIEIPDARPRTRCYARFKLAWVRFDLSDFEPACALFSEVAAEDDGLLGREAQRGFLMVLVRRGLRADEERRAIAGIARTPAERVELDQRYLHLLEDTGLEDRAAAFRAAQ
jgi:hypothetical protein